MTHFVVTPQNTQGEVVDLPEEEVQEMEAVAAARQAAIAANQWKEDRLSAYPPIGDQLDALFHAGVFPEEMAAQIQAVKDANPKPTE